MVTEGPTKTVDLVQLAISPRARRYGYVYWRKLDDQAMRGLLGDRDDVTVVFGEFLLGEKRIDWAHRRISLGWKQTRPIKKSLKVFALTIRRDGRLSIQSL